MSDASTPGREPLQIVELIQPRCGLTYGSAPCTAAVGVTGTRQCFNTRKTCQDSANYNASLGPNLAANPGFEDGDVDWFKLGTWAIINNVNARTGSWVARKTPGTDVSLRNDTSSPGLVACQEGDSFEAKCWAKASGVTDGTCRVSIQWLNSGLGSISFTNGTTTPLTTSYQQLTVQGTAPANAAFCRISISPGTVIATDTVYVDDAELRRIDPNSIVWRFAKPAAVLPRDLYQESGTVIRTHPIPTLLSVSTSPTRLNVGGGNEDAAPLGQRASVTALLQDHLSDDVVEDKYLSERDYNPIERSTFWAKWLARNPYHNGLLLQVSDGYAGQDFDDWQKRLYLVDRISGPDSNGRVTITAKDPLRLADDKRTQFPPVSQITLVGAIDDVTTTVEVLCAESELTADFGNTGSDRYLRINDEIILYTGYATSGTGEWTLSGVVRGELGTVAAEHDAEEQCQRVGRYEALEAWEVAKDLLLNHTQLDASYIDGSAWDAEGNAFLLPFVLTGTVAAPTPVVKLLGELTEQCPFYIWWDERAQTIRMKAVRPPIGDSVAQVNEVSHIIAGSASLKEDPNQRISRVILYYGQRDPTRPVEEIANYRSVRSRIDGPAESEAEHGDIRLRQIFSRWLTSSAQAIHTTTRILARFRDSVQFLAIKLDAKDRDITTADVLEVTTRLVVDETGAEVPRRWQVRSFEEILPGEVVLYDLQRFEFHGRFFIWAPDVAPADYDSATEQEREDMAFWADDNGAVGTNNDFGYQLL